VSFLEAIISVRAITCNISSDARHEMCCCDFDMKFTFVYAGWKGTMNDSRVFLNALGNVKNKFSWALEGI
jgi:hypothetical protein